MLKSRRRANCQLATDTFPIIQLWIVRLLIELGTHKEFLNDYGFANNGIAQAIGLGDWVDCTKLEFDHKKALAAVRGVHHEIEGLHKNASAPVVLKQNIERLSNLVGLSQIDCRILEFG